MTINGVKKILHNNNEFQLDENLNETIRTSDLRNKLVNISTLIQKI